MSRNTDMPSALAIALEFDRQRVIVQLYKAQNESSSKTEVASNYEKPHVPRRLPPVIRSRAVSRASPDRTRNVEKITTAAVSGLPRSFNESLVTSTNDDIVPSTGKVNYKSDEEVDIKVNDDRSTSPWCQSGIGELEAATTKQRTRHSVFYSDELNEVLLRWRPINVICHSARFQDEPSTVVLRDPHPNHLNPMQSCSTVEAKIALQAFAPDMNHVVATAHRRNLRRSEVAGPSTVFSQVEVSEGNVNGFAKAATQKSTPPSYGGKKLRRVASTNEKRFRQASQGSEILPGVLSRRRSAPSAFSPTPYLSSYKDSSEVPPRKRRKVANEDGFYEMAGVLPGTSQQILPAWETSFTYASASASSTSSASRSNGDFEAPDGETVSSASDSHSEDDVVYEAEILSVDEKNLVIQVLRLCREYVSEVDTKEPNWFDQLKMGVVLQVNELRRKINQAISQRSELRSKYGRLRLRHDFYMQQQQQQRRVILRMPVTNIDTTERSAAVQQQNCGSSFATSRGQWIEVPRHINHNSQIVAPSDTTTNGAQVVRNAVRVVNNGVRMQIPRPGRKPVTIRLTKNVGGVSVPPQHTPTQLYNIAAPKKIVHISQHPNASFISSFIPSR
ncbi:unnamed protein product [Toxocara canis]|uniref:DNA helicase n=1 Tax=Toxocara canis TaxID=6265 RepID=A0A183V929_TOXCA|nr:unnamed protein product [Toxocara canis]